MSSQNETSCPASMNRFATPVVSVLVASEETFSPASSSPEASDVPVLKAESLAPTETTATTGSLLTTTYSPFADVMRLFLTSPPQRSSEDVLDYYDYDYKQPQNDGPVQKATEAVPTSTTYDMTRERYCTAARYCYKDLNERCITRHTRTVCGCGRAYRRNPETLICEST